MIDSRKKNALVALFMLCFGFLGFSTTALAEYRLWGIVSETLYEYTVESDAWVEIGLTAIPGDDDLGLAYSPSEELLYAIDENGVLYSIDPTDATTTEIGDTGLSDGTTGDYGAAFMAGVLYVTLDDTESLYTVDTSTATPTLVADNIGDIEALAPGNDPNGPLYATLEGDPDDIQGTLTRDTGVFTPFPGDPSLAGDRGLGLAGGLIYGSDEDDFGSLDPITGEIVVLSGVTGGDMEGLAGDGSAAVSPLPVPTLPFYGLLLLAALLGVFALRKL